MTDTATTTSTIRPAGSIDELLRDGADILAVWAHPDDESYLSGGLMAAAAAAKLHGGSPQQIEYAAEMGLEHHLGLTCDPVDGLVQIPCIERNAVAAMRAINAVSLANFLASSRKISLDIVISTMYQTGLDMHKQYKETSEGGLAKAYRI